jgi:hypothetical protein
VDPNNNGNAGEINENIPTPFNFGLIPVKFLSVHASSINNNTSLIKWNIATPTVNAEKFEVEFSIDGRNWSRVKTIPVTDPARGSYEAEHNFIPVGNIYYRIKETDIDGAYIYSTIVLLRTKTTEPGFVLYPNPANNYIQVSLPGNINGKNGIELFDATGRRIWFKQMLNNTEDIHTSGLPNGTYMLKLNHNGEVKTQKVLIVH